MQREHIFNDQTKQMFYRSKGLKEKEGHLERLHKEIEAASADVEEKEEECAELDHSPLAFVIYREVHPCYLALSATSSDIITDIPCI